MDRLTNIDMLKEEIRDKKKTKKMQKGQKTDCRRARVYLCV